MSGYEIKRQSQVKGAEVKFNRSTGLSAILVVGLAILFWWVLTTLKMERQESKDGRRKHTRVLLIIIIIAALAFLSIAEENFFGRATALIGSITLLLPNLMTLLGSITRMFTKRSTPANT